MLNTSPPSTSGRSLAPLIHSSNPWRAQGCPVSRRRHSANSRRLLEQHFWATAACDSQCKCAPDSDLLRKAAAAQPRSRSRCAATKGNGTNGNSMDSNGQQASSSDDGEWGSAGEQNQQQPTAGTDRLRNAMQKFRKLSGELAGDWKHVANRPQQQQPSASQPSNTQSQRLRSLMQNFGMAGLPGMGLGVAANVANQQQNGGAGPKQAVQGGAAVAGPPPRRKLTAAEATEWGSDWTEDWDPEEDLDEEARMALADEAEAKQRAGRGQGPYGTPRDKWITPLLDLRAVTGAVDPDQERTEVNLQTEALANKDESQTAIRYAAQLFIIPLVTGFVLSRALADPVLSFTLQNNSEAFAMTDRQKIEGAEKVHIEEARLRFDMAIGKIPPLSEEQILEHLREFAEEVVHEERLTNEQNLITVVSDSISSIILFMLISQSSRGRQALFNTISRLFEGLSDIAKAVMIILIADTLLGYHSEEGWTGLIELVVGHYGFEAEEEGLVIFVGIVPVVIDVFFKYWIFIGLNRISPGAVITLKQIDTH